MNLHKQKVFGEHLASERHARIDEISTASDEDSSRKSMRP